MFLQTCIVICILFGIINGLCQSGGGYSGRDYSSDNLFTFLFKDKY